MKKPKTNRIMVSRGLETMALKLVRAAYGRGYRAAKLHYQKLAKAKYGLGYRAHYKNKK
jgi:hypothetical protein